MTQETATIVAALITGILGIIGGLLVGYREEVVGFFTRKVRSIEGVWSGTAYDIPIPGHLQYSHPLKYEVTAKITQHGKRVKVALTSKSDRTNHITVKGVLEGDYLNSSYKNDDKNIIDYGSSLIKLLGTGKDMKGYFLGRRMREEGVVFGYAELFKE
ncbi:MAG: hypothetical protein RPU52_02355 [Candidatus Sedimenticola sp. (ex Thyasira tokunagai)]